MKAKIHPNYRHDVKVTCACGNTFTTGSVLSEINVDICSACHPFYTGEMKFVDTQGRVERFKQKMQKGSKSYVSKKQRKQAKKASEEKTQEVKTLKEMIQDQRKAKAS
ncbi:MAG: 50S ribosomal protein L31 [Patescibacteria group bacterium]|jgi:large subunit ribosomal protein L31